MKKAIRIDDDLWTRVVAAAARTGRQPEDVVLDAVRRYVGEHPADVLDRLPTGEMSEGEAMELALREVKAYRSGR